MAIPMTDRFNTAERDTAFRNRIQARMLDNAQAAYLATPLANGTLQAKRLALASAIQKDAAPYVSPFAWWMVSIASYTVPEDITDTQITNNLQVTGAHDQLADQLIPTAAVVIPESSGVTAVGAAITSVASINHGLGSTPTADKFWFAFAADPLAAGHCWASSITSTTFTLNLKAAPGGAGTSVAWRVRAT